MKRARQTKYIAVFKDPSGRGVKYRQITSAIKGRSLKEDLGWDGTVEIYVATSIALVLLKYPGIVEAPAP
jgi:hypothetical protein